MIFMDIRTNELYIMCVKTLDHSDLCDQFDITGIAFVGNVEPTIERHMMASSMTFIGWV